MKRLIMLAVLCAFVLSAAAASAADLKASGYVKSDAVWASNWDFSDGNDGVADSTRNMLMAERIEFSLSFVASEDLKAVITLRQEGLFGQDIGLGDSDGIVVRKAYVDFNWPGTAVNIKVGHQGVALPNAFGGSLLLDGRTSAVLVSTPLGDAAALTAGLLRVDDGFRNSQTDVYALIADFNVADANIKPFFAMTNAGSASTYLSASELDSAIWLGAAASMSVGEFNLTGDFNYGSVSAEADADDATGFAVLLSAEMAMDMMTPQAYFVYTSGEDDDATDGSERMPQLGPDWAIGSFYFGGDAWLNGSINAGNAPLGFWALGVTLKDINSFADGLFHYATLIYAMGTNDKDSGVGYGELTTEDTLVEVDFNTYYKLYDELTVGVELGYLYLDADDDVHPGDGGSAYKVSTGLKYSF